MKTSTLMVVLSTMALGALGVGCASSGAGEDADSSEGAATGPTTAISAGDYVVVENESFGATLSIKSVGANSLAYSYGILGKSGSQHNGELEGRTAYLSGGAFVDTIDADCKMTFHLVGEDIAMTQTGTCSDAGFGAFLDGTGVYKKKAATKWVGLYEMETTHRAWAIRVTSEAPFKFSIVAGHYEDKTERVDAKLLTGKMTDGYVTYENGPDCALTLSRTDWSLHVVQTGTCKVLGFPANDDLSMGDATGADFSSIDESQQCFDKTELSVMAGKNLCKNPL